MSGDEPWEARMARLSRERADAADRQRQDQITQELLARSTETIDWLNGWPRTDISTVRMGTGIHCIGCGRCRGTVCTAFHEDWEPPGPEPVWPFPQTSCPVCGRR